MQGVGKAHIDAYEPNRTETQRAIPYSPYSHELSFCTVAREKMDTVASKMESVAKNSIRLLSDIVETPKDSAALSREASSILCLTLYNSSKSNTSWNEFSSTDPRNSHALSIHLSGGDRQICLRNQGGSSVFSLPAGSMLVTIGKQIQVSCYCYIYYSFMHVHSENCKADQINA